MKTKTSTNPSIIEKINHKNRVNINIIKNRIFQEKKKKQIQNRIIFVSAIVSVGVISYLAG